MTQTPENFRLGKRLLGSLHTPIAIVRWWIDLEGQLYQETNIESPKRKYETQPIAHRKLPILSQQYLVYSDSQSTAMQESNRQSRRAI